MRLGPFEIPYVGPRHVRVCLPPGYHRHRRAHPLLFMWDGQNVFDDAPSFSGGWHLDALVARRHRAGKVTPVVAALEHGGAMRLRELSPLRGPGGAPLLEPLLEWVAVQLIPILRVQLRLLAEPKHNVVGGSSLGGLAALYAHLRRPELFGGCMSMSPSLFLGRAAILDYAASVPRPWTSRVYLDAGGREAGGRVWRLVQRLEATLAGRGWGDQELCARLVKSHGHNEVAWRRRAPGALDWLFDRS